MKNILAFCLGAHDSNVSYYNSKTGTVSYFKTERIVAVKHHRAKHDFLNKLCEEHDLQPDMICVTGWPANWSDHNFYECGPINGLSDRLQVKTIYIDHHYAHILSAWPLLKTRDIEFGVAMDGQGDRMTSARVMQFPFSSNPKLVKEVKCEYSSVGNTFTNTGTRMKLVGNSIDFAGKIMGLQAYGKTDDEYMKVTDFRRINNSLLNPDPDFYNIENQEFLDWIACLQELSSLHILDFFQQHFSEDSSIVYSGGCANNTLCNERLFNKYKNLTIPPHAYDGGLSLGCLEFGRILCGIEEFQKPNFPYWQQDFVQPANQKTIDAAAKMLADGKVVGWFQGSGEIGPRALGNRSILLDPRMPDGKKFINSKVKHREHWRPYAPSVLCEHASEWFDIDPSDESPYMLRAIKVRPDKAHLIPSVVHEDGTSRIQTVKEEFNPTFYNLIKKFYELTNIPLVLNTSLNGNGSPIFSRKSQCLRLLEETSLDVIFYGDDMCCKIKI